MIIKKLYEKIFYYEDIIENSKNFINDIEQSDFMCTKNTSIGNWEKWTASNDLKKVYGVGKSGMFDTGMMVTPEDFTLYKISSVIKNVSDFAISSYCNIHMIDKPWLPNFFNIKKYTEGADMGPHVDSSDPTNIKHPIISGVIYLNDDYLGGDIVFPNQNVTIKPKAGSLLLFPSSEPYVHHPHKIDGGVKYIVPLFWYKEPF
jgi:hypothetical protein